MGKARSCAAESEVFPYLFNNTPYAMLEGGILVSRVSGNTDQMAVLINMLKREIEENSVKVS